MKHIPAQVTVLDEWRLMRWVAALDEVLAWYANAEYRGHTLKRDKRGWLLVVKATRQGTDVVAFYNGHRPWVCFYSLAWDLKHGRIYWKTDRPPQDVGD